MHKPLGYSLSLENWCGKRWTANSLITTGSSKSTFRHKTANQVLRILASDSHYSCACQCIAPLQENLDLDYSACGFQAAGEFCPHSVGHYLGMDTHDTHLVSKGLGLHPGMVITIEPGIYISENNKNIPERFAILSYFNTTVTYYYTMAF